MGVRTVRLDEDTEEVLEQLVKETGLSISAIFREGLLALRDRLPETPRRLPFEIYEELDLGPGGYAIAPSTETRQGRAGGSPEKAEPELRDPHVHGRETEEE